MENFIVYKLGDSMRSTLVITETSVVLTKLVDIATASASAYNNDF